MFVNQPNKIKPVLNHFHLNRWIYFVVIFLGLVITGKQELHQPVFFSAKHGLNTFHSNVEFKAHNGFGENGEIIYVEVAEEDDLPDEYQIHDFQQKNFSHHELGYSSSIHARFLQLTFSFQRQAEEPIFVLNHSWRSHIS